MSFKVTGQFASARHDSTQAIQSILPLLDVILSRKSVVQEIILASWFQNPIRFFEHGIYVVHGAQHIYHYHRIKPTFFKRQMFTFDLIPFDCSPRCICALFGARTQPIRWLDGGQSLDVLWIKSQVRARADSNLKDFSLDIA